MRRRRITKSKYHGQSSCVNIRALEYPKRSEWMHETMVLTAVRHECPSSGAGPTEWHNCEILLVDTVGWDYT
eukprot:600846-Karenia_brevis.AAC.1